MDKNTIEVQVLLPRDIHAMAEFWYRTTGKSKHQFYSQAITEHCDNIRKELALPYPTEQRYIINKLKSRTNYVKLIGE